MTEESREEKEDQETGKRGPSSAKASDGKNGEAEKDAAAAGRNAVENPAADGTPEAEGAGQARNPEPASGDTAAPGSGDEAPSDTSPHPFEELLDEYPLRDASEDPVWSVRIVKGWMWFLAFCFAGILLLLVLGLFYD